MAQDDVDVFNVTIAGGVISVSQGSGIYNIDTEGGAATDEITQITGATHPNVYALRVHTAGHYWTLNHNPAGGIRLMYGQGFETANPDDEIHVRTSDKGAYVYEFIPRVIIHST